MELPRLARRLLPGGAPAPARYLTHVKRLTDLALDDERLDHALEHLPPGRHAFEFRHESWFDPAVYARLRARNVALVSAHRKGLGLPLDVVTADFAFLRFHYGERGRRGNYSDTELDEHAARVRALAREELDVYAYFNNDWEAFAPRNAAGLRARS